MNLTLPLIVLVLTLAVCLPWLGLHLGLLYRVKRHHLADLAAKSKVIADQEVTIAAYRELVSIDNSFSLTEVPGDASDATLGVRNPLSA